MKLKMFTNIMFVLFITITTSYSQTGVWLVEEPNQLYFDLAKGDGEKDTLARFETIPLWLTPGIAKLGVQHPDQDIVLSSESENIFSHLGLYRQSQINQKVTRFVDGTFTNPEVKVEYGERKLNYMLIISAGISFLFISLFAYLIPFGLYMEHWRGVAAVFSIIVGIMSFPGVVISTYKAVPSAWSLIIPVLLYGMWGYWVYRYSKSKNSALEYTFDESV